MQLAAAATTEKQTQVHGLRRNRVLYVAGITEYSRIELAVAAAAAAASSTTSVFKVVVHLFSKNAICATFFFFLFFRLLKFFL